MNVRFQVLGTLRVQAGDADVTIAGHRLRALLAMLLNPGHAVSIERLVDAVWGADPPGDARNRVQVSISRLRARLAAAGIPRELILTEPAGYRIMVEADSLDLLQFRRLRDEGRAAAANGRPDEARERYRAAVALWRGPPADVESDLVRHAMSILEDERVTGCTRRSSTATRTSPRRRSHRLRPMPAAPRPRELPADVAGFTGRAEALEALDELLPDGTASPPALVISAMLAGPAGSCSSRNDRTPTAKFSSSGWVQTRSWRT